MFSGKQSNNSLLPLADMKYSLDVFATALQPLLTPCCLGRQGMDFVSEHIKKKKIWVKSFHPPQLKVYIQATLYSLFINRV